jgi:hypothetical protein
MVFSDVRKMLKKRPVSLEHQIEVLKECGYALKPDIAVETLLRSFDRDQYENDPYLLTLIIMGSEEIDEAAFLPGSEKIWAYDAECIENHYDYVRKAMSLRDLADGGLPIENITDYVDVEEGEAWLAFELNGKKYKWLAEVDDDWLDPNILVQFAELLASLNTGRRFIWLHDGGQGGLIGCSTKEQLELLNKKTGLQFQWLDDPNFLS